MFKDQKLYYPVWQKYLPVLQLQIKNAVNGEKEITMFKKEFALHGNKNLTDYSFNLEIQNGKVISNTGATVVARDLNDVMKESKSITSLLATSHCHIELGKDFVLKINVKPDEVEVVSPVAAEETVEG